MWLAGDGDGKRVGAGVGGASPRQAVTMLQTQGSKAELLEVCSQEQTGNKLVQSQNVNQH